jgi:hypothetical protein
VSKRILPACLAILLLAGALVEVTPALARRGADDSLEKMDDRGRGRGQDDSRSDRKRRQSRKSKQLWQGEDRSRGRGFDDSRKGVFPDDSSGRGDSRGRGGDDR